jgi:hypothetical protein
VNASFVLTLLVFVVLVVSAMALIVLRAESEWNDPPGPAVRRPGGTALISRMSGDGRAKVPSGVFPRKVRVTGPTVVAPPRVPALNFQRAAGINVDAPLPLPPPAGVDENGLLVPPVDPRAENERRE